MTAPRTLAWSTLTTVLTVLLLTLPASPSAAEPKRLLVGTSASGPFHDNLSRPLFAGDAPFVPRDDVTRRFWVKNNSRQVARATVAVVDRGGSNVFEDALTFQVDYDGVRSSHPVNVAESCELVTTGPTLDPGAVQAIDVRLLVADLRRQVGMRQTASVDFVVTLSQLGEQGQVEVCGEQDQADPDDQAAADPDEQADRCDRDVVVTAVGTPTCVPTAVDAGRASRHGDGPVRDPGIVGLTSVLLLGAGGFLLLLRRRRDRDADRS